MVLKFLRLEHGGEKPVKTRTVPMCSHPSYGQEVKGLRIFHGFSNMEVLRNLGKGYFGEVMGVKVVKEILEI